MSDIEWSPWIEHVGEDCPVDGMTKVCVQFADGQVIDDNAANLWHWNGFDGRAAQITHYRIRMEDYRRIYGEPDIKADMESHPNSELDADQYTVGGDTVNMPSHYTSGEIECIDAIQAQMTPEQFAGYLRGNCIKYIWRYQHKGGKESLLKAQWYLNRLIDVVE